MAVRTQRKSGGCSIILDFREIAFCSSRIDVPVIVVLKKKMIRRVSPAKVQEINTQDLKTIGDLINQLKGLYSQLEESVASSSVAASLNPDKTKWLAIHMLLAAKEKNLTLEQAMDDPEILEQVLEKTDSENIHTRVDEKLLEELTTILTEPLIAHWREEFRDYQVGFKKAFNE